MIRVLVVDDEAPARQRLITLLAEQSDIVLAGACSNGIEAIASIMELRPDIVFLDVQMPELNGFQVLEAVGPGQIPALIFVTAYDQFALRAFDARAIDYLLKPFTTERFLDSMERARTRLAHPADSVAARRLLLQETLASAVERRLALRTGRRIVLLRTTDINRVDGAGNYVEVHTDAAVHRVRSTLREMAARLEASGFIRISHSTIVNRDRISSIERGSAGSYTVILRDGSSLPSSPAYTSSLRALL